MKKIAISACLMGRECRYDASSNIDEELLKNLKEYELIPFCPEDYTFGSPRPTMDLIEIDSIISAISNENGDNLSDSIEEYAKDFFDTHRDIDLYIGKDRSPSCGVCSAKIYNRQKVLISAMGVGLMSKEAQKRGIKSIDAQKYFKEII